MCKQASTSQPVYQGQWATIPTQRSGDDRTQIFPHRSYSAASSVGRQIYYESEGLNVQINHSNVRDALIQVAQCHITCANASGDQVLLAHSNEIPIKLVFQTWQQFPVALFAKASTEIEQPSDLQNKVVGVPGRFGATYIGLQALLYATGLPEEEVRIAEIGFTQAAAVR